MKLTMPKGFMPPKDARPNEPFEVVATLSPSEDGTFSIVAIDGVKLPEEDDNMEMEEEDMPVTERTDSSQIRIPYEQED